MQTSQAAFAASRFSSWFRIQTIRTAPNDTRPEPVLDGAGGQRQGEVVSDTAVHQLVLVARVVGRAARVALDTDGRVRTK